MHTDDSFIFITVALFYTHTHTRNWAYSIGKLQLESENQSFFIRCGATQRRWMALQLNEWMNTRDRITNQLPILT
jgi:hypothetical protein